MLVEMGKKARLAARQLARTDTEDKNVVLERVADKLLVHADQILEANALDIIDGEKAGLTPALIERLTLNVQRLEGIAAEQRQVVNLPDPVGEVFEVQRMANGLEVSKMRVPLGVLGVIYESRPNVTVDIAGLALKSGNAAILRGGKETLRTNRELVAVIRAALAENGLPTDAIQFINDSDRALVSELLRMHDYIDMLIPRGGQSLHQYCRENSTIPVITGGIGICHLYVDQTADLDASIEVIQNAKIQRPTVCNALDTVLVHQAIAPAFLARLVEKLEQEGVFFRADSAAMDTLSENGILPESVSAAGPEDFDTEWLSLVLGIKIVEDLDDAIAHIEAHSTAHSDGILTRNEENAQQFISQVDSAVVYVNASTRFTDGNQLGLGAEVAISTQRLHARGPMALRELTTYKWVVKGEYHVRQ